MGSRILENEFPVVKCIRGSQYLGCIALGGVHDSVDHIECEHRLPF